MDLSTSVAVFAVVVSVVSTVTSWLATKESRRQTELAESAAQVSTVIHFTSRFLDLVDGGMNFTDDTWAMKYWRLQATEFYFFLHNWLPPFIYEIWISELADAYQSDPLVWETHDRYLTKYAANNPGMRTFFQTVAGLGTATPEREATIRALVADVEHARVPQQRRRGHRMMLSQSS